MSTKFLNKMRDIKVRKNISMAIAASISVQDFSSSNIYYMHNGSSFNGGVFPLMEENNMLLLETLITIGDVNLDNVSESIDSLYSIKSEKIQKAIFRKNYLKPLKKWLKNRGIKDKNFAIKLMSYKMQNAFDDIASYLDDIKSYTLLDITRYQYLNQ